MASLPSDCDADFCRELLIAAESEFVAASLAIERERADKESDENA